jgi:hypothetical protein
MQSQLKEDESKEDESLKNFKHKLSEGKGKVCFICNLIRVIAAWSGTYILVPTLFAIVSLSLLVDKNVALTSLMWALACLTFGTCVGFLFALPKRQANQSNQLKDQSKTYSDDGDSGLFPNKYLCKINPVFPT